jgi:hypothetical protein
VGAAAYTGTPPEPELNTISNPMAKPTAAISASTTVMIIFIETR